MNEINETDHFYLEKLFPNLSDIVFNKFQSLKDLSENCLYVLDTNSLLVPFTISKESLSKIENIYKKLISEKRLFIPGRAIREFAKNRSEKIKELHTHIYQQMSNIPSVPDVTCPLLEDLDIFKQYIESQKTLKVQIKDYKQKLSTLLYWLENYNWNDPVSVLYSNIFNNDMIFDFDLSNEENKK